MVCNISVVCIVEVGSICTAWHRILGDGVAAAVSLAERSRPPAVLQLLCSNLLHHRRRRQFCGLLLQRSRYQPTSLGSHPVVNTGPCDGTHLLQQSDCGDLGHNHNTHCGYIAHSASVLCARRSAIYYEILVCEMQKCSWHLVALCAFIHNVTVLSQSLIQEIGPIFLVFATVSSMNYQVFPNCAFENLSRSWANFSVISSRLHSTKIEFVKQ